MSICVKVNGQNRFMDLNEIYLLEFNPNHDDKGEFAAGSGSSDELTHEDLAKSGVNDKNYKTFLMKNPTTITAAQYVAAKQLHAYHERGDVLPIKTAQSWYASYKGNA